MNVNQQAAVMKVMQFERVEEIPKGVQLKQGEILYMCKVSYWETCLSHKCAFRELCQNVEIPCVDINTMSSWFYYIEMKAPTIQVSLFTKIIRSIKLLLKVVF